MDLDTLPNTTIANNDNIITNDNNISTKETKKIDKKETTIKNYKIIYSVFFKYWLIALIIAIAIAIFFLAIKKEKILNINSDNESQKDLLIQKYNNEINNKLNIETSNKDLNIKIRQGTLNINEETLLSYNNLILFKWFTLPRWIFIYKDSIENRDYFNDSNYDIEELSKFIKNIIFVNYDEIISEKNGNTQFIQLDNNSVEKTFFLSCANRPRLLNRICDKYIENFLNWFFVYNINSDFSWFTKTMKNLIIKRKYKDSVCKWLDNYVMYSNSAPAELEDLAILCWWTFLDNYYMMQDFTKTKNELEWQYITPGTSKYKKMNEYKLVSYQQILYNNLEKWIPPSEWTYKSYTNYLSNLLKKHNQSPIDPFYFDETYRFNNLYIIPSLNKVKYQSTQSKIEEISTIINDLEKINNWDKIEGYIWLNSILTNKSLEEDVSKIWVNFISERDDIMSILLKSLQSLNYIKIINDEIIWDTIRINWYIPRFKLNNWESFPIPFWSTLLNKNWKLVVKEFSLNIAGFDAFQINDVLKIMLEKRDYNIGEIYEFIQNNMDLYETNDYSASPCDLLKNRFDTIKIDWLQILICNDEKINITKWISGNKILYQFKMEEYNIKSITTTNNAIQKYINEHYSWITSNAVTINWIVSDIVTYEPQKQEQENNYLEWNNNAIIAIDDFKKYLWIDIVDIWERNWKVAAEFSITNINFVWIYDIETKKLWPIFLKQPGEEKWNIIISNFSLYLLPENQYEINKFLIEPIGYLYNLDKRIVIKYLPNLLADYLTSKLGQ